jgi:hypothetical protein
MYYCILADYCISNYKIILLHVLFDEKSNLYSGSTTILGTICRNNFLSYQAPYLVNNKPNYPG